MGEDRDQRFGETKGIRILALNMTDPGRLPPNAVGQPYQ
jgi:hypothetical protein